MRTYHCGEVNESLLDEQVTVCGWAQRRRDHGGVIFIDLRDASGVLQVVIDPDAKDAFAIAESVRNEFVLQITAKVRLRPEGTTNPNLPTGMVEVYATEVTVLNRAEPLPFQLDDENVGEAVRLEHRYLDLRGEKMQRTLRLRHKVTQHMRNFLDQNDFVDIETPMLTKSTPEGARDYLVPSRVHPGKFFALPQSPQLFKQLLMVAGYERYYQIARCFRDEDLRADRQPEFTQLDIEMSFMNEDEIMGMMEGMVRDLFKSALDIDLTTEFPRMTYAQAIEDFGIDRPDLRNPLRLVTVSDIMSAVDFNVFSGPANDPEGRVAAILVPQGSEKLSRKEIDSYTKFVGNYGARGLAYIKVNGAANGRDGLQSPIVKNLSDESLDNLLKRLGAKDGDLIFFGADKANIVNDSLAALRNKLGVDLDLLTEKWSPMWVVDFPMFEQNGEGNWTSLHHPFTAPFEDQIEQLKTNPGEVLSRAYDLVLNGTELGGGSIRIHDQNIQKLAFEALGIDDAEAEEKFGFLLNGLKYGAPPHGGIAFGLDRIVAMMSEVDSIRDVIAFPKTQSASCLMTDAPDSVDNKQLKELHVKLRPSAEKDLDKTDEKH